MRWVVLLVMLATMPAMADLQYLTRTTPNETAFETTGLTTWQNPGDDDSKQVNIGFNFPFNGTSYTQVHISSNGTLSFTSANHAFNNTELSNNSSNDYQLFPYWEDLNPPQGGSIKYGTIGSGSNMHFVVWWDRLARYRSSGALSFQAVLYKDGSIRFRYLQGSNADGTYVGNNPGSDRDGGTVGVKEDSSHYDQYIFNEPLDQSKDVLYVPNPINTTIVSPECATPAPKISLSTYNTTGYNSYPNNSSEYQTLINNYATNDKLFGGGYVDNITVSSNSNNNPYNPGTDSNYLALFKGYIYMPETGIYKFGIDGDDAVEVYIDDTLVTGWYGGHGAAHDATHIKFVKTTAGYHKIEYHMQERYGGDSYYLYWQPPSGNSIVIVPPTQFFHCQPSINKKSCIINDPVNNTTNPKRIPGATIRYAIEIDNTHFDAVQMNNSLITDDLNANLETGSITNLRIVDGACNCQSPGATSPNGNNGTGNGVNPVKLDFGTVDPNSKECGYFEVKIK